LQAADPGEQQVADDDVRPSGEGEIDSGGAVLCFNGLPAMASEKARDALSAFGVVFDE
jgi:hypothetical protein